MKKNRFHLEEEIMKCWNIIDDLDIVLDSEDSDELVKSIQNLYEHKFQSLWNTFSEMVANGQFKKVEF
jgi:flagellin-specific chaperone FliS